MNTPAHDAFQPEHSTASMQCCKLFTCRLLAVIEGLQQQLAASRLLQSTHHEVLQRVSTCSTTEATTANRQQQQQPTRNSSGINHARPDSSIRPGVGCTAAGASPAEGADTVGAGNRSAAPVMPWQHPQGSAVWDHNGNVTPAGMISRDGSAANGGPGPFSGSSRVRSPMPRGAARERCLPPTGFL